MIYETAPVKCIVAEAEIVDVLICSPSELWEMTKKESGISKDLFDEYFKGKEIAYTYKLGKITIYKQPKMLRDYGIKAAPQSFMYV